MPILFICPGRNCAKIGFEMKDRPLATPVRKFRVVSAVDYIKHD